MTVILLSKGMLRTGPDKIRRLLLLLLLLLALIPATGTPGTAQAALLSDQDHWVYQEAFEAVRQNKWSEALKTASRAANPIPYKIILWTKYRYSRVPTPFSELAEFIRRNPDWPSMSVLRRRAEDALDSSVADRVVLAWFEDYPPVTVDGAMRYARILNRVGQASNAGYMIRRTWIDKNMRQSQEKAFLDDFGAMLDERDHVARLDRLLWEGQIKAAIRMKGLVSRERWLVARARIRLMTRHKNVKEALAEVPDGLRHDAGLRFELARWYRRQKNLDDAVAVLEIPPKRLVKPDKWWQERSYLVREMLMRGDISLAYRLARDHGLTSGVGFAEGEFLAGWIATRFLREHLTGYQHFSSLYRGVRYPISIARGAYWSGRAAEAAGDAQVALAWYETASRYLTTYYGQLGAARLGSEGRFVVPPPPEPSASDRRAFEDREVVQAIKLLYELDETKRITPFYYTLSQDIDTYGETLLLARLMRDIGRADLALHTAKDLLRRGVVMADLLFPLVDIDPSEEPEHALVLSLIRQESAFNDKAVSHAGARGLMQLMPTTAKGVARRIGISYSKDRLTTDPDYNVQLGRAYLKGVLDRFNGSYILGLTSYNAGPGRTQQWIEEFGDPRNPEIDPVDWVEMIPFDETRNYVQRILETVQIYRHRLGLAQTLPSIYRDLTR